METTLHYDESSDRLHILTVQDVEPILEANKHTFDHDNRRFNKQFNHVARIPLIVIEQQRKLGNDLMGDEAALRRFLNDKDNAFMRTKPGRI